MNSFYSRITFPSIELCTQNRKNPHNDVSLNFLQMFFLPLHGEFPTTHLKINVSVFIHVKCSENVIAKLLSVARRKEHLVHICNRKFR